MQLRHDQLSAHLAKGPLKAVYTLHGDEPLLQQEAGDAIRAAARAAGFTERQVHTVAGAHFDWSGLIGAASEMSLFGDRQLIEIRIPSGKPGKDGSEALQRYCEAAAGNDGLLTMVSLPRLDKQQQSSAWFTALDGAGLSVRCDPIERQALPMWIAQRLAAQGQQVEGGEAGQRTLAFFADRVEGNLLAAHQEIIKLGLLHGPGTLTAEQIEAAVVDVARFNVFKLSETVLSGHIDRTLRMLEGLEAEGEAAVLVHWTLSEDILTLQRARRGLDGGKPLPMVLRELRVWGPRERHFERILPRIKPAAVSRLLASAAAVDGVIKGLRHPQWPADPWEAIRRLAVQLSRAVA
ncbi:DNA polymerase III subunit delta [Aquabacterium fontiphilum]|uniref:DNA polymerase III subunit delta n=1 Tax=Aquabacterium fontiphilum TaxID=450365 RepID=UPI0013778CA4|nr:DNA polymerase III subunit delta [Aquabacterium fontiphilum]NBD19227.1 DNA polymerase III subunit delta [Aquabacterium fontiphilum]